MLSKLQVVVSPATLKWNEQVGQFLLALQFLLSQAALMSLVFALWRFGADMNLTGQFFLTDGLWSRWQVWLALAVALKMASSTLIRQPGTEQQDR